MKKSFLLALALLVTIPAYMAFIISRSEKDHDKFIQRYDYPGMNSFSVSPSVNVWIEKNDSNYMECKGCDTSRIFEAQTLKLDETVEHSYVFYDTRKNWHYKVGMKEIGSVIADQNALYMDGLKQKNLQVTLSGYGYVGLGNCELDTVFVTIEGFGDKELYFESGCRIKHIIVEGKRQSSDIAFSVFSGVHIENLVVNEFDGDFDLNVSAELLSKMNFKLNGRQVTTADTTTPKSRSN